MEEGGASRRNDERSEREPGPKGNGSNDDKMEPKSGAAAKPAAESKAEAKAGERKADPRSGDKAKSNKEELGRRQERMRMSSDVDAMGQDKHRQVIGQHKPNRGRQLLYYGIFIAVLVVAYVGLGAAVKQLDKAPAHDPAKAPWAKQGAPQIPLGGFEPRHPGQKGPTHFQ